MNIDELITFVSELSDGVVTWTPDENSDAPEIAWGDTFFFYSPAGNVTEARRQPFATIVTKDYTDSDEFSDLDRPGAFRVNIAVGRTTFTELLGYAPKEHAEHHAGIDYAAADRLLPHPVYAAQGYVAVVSPGPETGEQVRALLRQAHDLDAERYHRRQS